MLTGGLAIISGSGFDEKGANDAVYFGTTIVDVVTWAATEIQVNISTLAPGVYSVYVYKDGIGNSNSE